MDPISLTGKVAVVTGSARGLGLEFAKALAAAGASVVVNDLDADAVAATVAAIESAGGRAVGVAAAVGSAEAADRIVQCALTSYGRLDLFCANAGILRDRMLWNMTDDDFDDVIAVHLRGTFTCVRSAVRQMRAQGQGGRIVLVSSLAGQRGNVGQTNYSAAKAGIAAFTRTWAMECERAGITVNAMLPVAMTRMLASVPGFGPHVEAAERGEPIPSQLRRFGFGTAADVAPLLVFLASEHAARITGQCIGLGGDKLSLWSHPKEISAAFKDGGWTAEALAEAWSGTVGQTPETVGDDTLQRLKS